MTLKVIPRLQAFSSVIRRTFVLYFIRFQLTARSRGPSATAGLLILYKPLFGVVRDGHAWQVVNWSNCFQRASSVVYVYDVEFIIIEMY